jgi:hypothetical protein
MVVTSKNTNEPVKQANGNELFPKSLLPVGKFEVSENTTFTVKLYLKEFKGRWQLMDGPANGVETHTVVFKMWNFNECLAIRREANYFDPQNRVNRTDNDKLNRLKIMKLMKEWTLNKDNPRLEIQCVNGVLTEASWRAFCSLQPNIADEIISQMNRILDYGG